MFGFRRRTWRRELQALVDELIRSQDSSPARVTACLEQVQRADVTIQDDVSFAIGQMFRVIDGFRGTDAAEMALDGIVEIVIASFTATAEPQFLYGVPKHFQRRGLSDVSVSLLERAIALEEGKPTGGRPDVAAGLFNELGEVLRDAGQLGDAAALFRDALAALDTASERHDDKRAAILNNLGLAASGMGDLPEAKRYLLESLEIEDRLDGEPVAIAITLDNLGVIESDLAKAAGPLRLSDDYVNLAVDDHLRQAEEYFERAGKLFEKALPGSADDYIANLVNQADAATQRGDSAKRERLTTLALEIGMRERISIVTMWEAVVHRGEALLAGGRADEAADLLAEWWDRVALEMASHERLSRGLTVLIRAASAIEDRDLMEQAAGNIVAVDTRILPNRLVGGSEAATQAMFVGFKKRTDLILGICLPSTPTRIAPSWLYDVVLDSKGVLAERQGSAWLRAREFDRVESDLLDRVRELRSEVARLDLDGSGSEAIQVARRRHEDAERRLGKAEMDLQRALGPLGEEIPPVGIEDVQAVLPPDTLLLDFVTTELPDGSRHYVAFKIRNDGPVRFIDLGEVGDIDDRLDALTSAVASLPQGDQGPVVIDGLAPKIFEPSEEIEERLIVSPTGPWGTVPFCLLPDEAGRPLIDRHIVTLTPSARALVTRTVGAIPNDGPRSRASVVVGDPDFDLQFAEQVGFFPSLRLERLEHTIAEANEVADLLGVKAATQGEATRGLVLDLRGPKILHVASHGIFLKAIRSLAELSEPRETSLRMVAGSLVSEESDVLGWSRAAEDTPDEARALHESRVTWLLEIGPAGQLSRSVLLLAGFNAWLAGVTTPPEVGTGMLSAGEFALLDLAETELVVLSACETGVGAVSWADGSLLGLRTAALAAGAASCVSTLWEVEDAAAAALVSTFYGGLKSGDERASALRAAQLEIRRTHPEPFFWAGWVAEGANGPIRLS